MFAGVKFISDNTVSVVPINHIKNFKFPVEANKSYQVFWSENPEDEPTPDHKNVDKTYKTLCSKKEHKGSLPPVGYFNAKILCTADTFEEASEALNALGLPLQKRVIKTVSKASSMKLINSAASSVVRASMIDNSLKFTDDDDDDDTDADETVEPVNQFKDRIKCLEAENSKLEEMVKRLKFQLLEADEKIQKANEEKNNFSKQLLRTKEKYRDLKEEFKTARHLNYELQNKIIASINVTVSPNQLSTPQLNNQMSVDLPVECSNNEQQHNTCDSQSLSLISNPSWALPSSCNNMKRKFVKSTDDDCQLSVKKCNLNDIDRQIMIVDETPQVIPETPEMVTEHSSSTDDNFFLSDMVIRSSGMGCKNGKDGDKVFIKNLAVNLFGKSMLMNSSATGRKPPTGGKPPRPALPKAGIAYIQSVLEQRIEKELSVKSGLTEDEKKQIMAQRSSLLVVNQAIGDKIATLRRAS